MSEVAARTSDCCGDIAILELPIPIVRNFYIITRKTGSPSPLTQEIVGYLVEAIRQR